MVLTRFHRPLCQCISVGVVLFASAVGVSIHADPPVVETSLAEKTDGERESADELSYEKRQLQDEVLKLAIEKELLASGAIEGKKIEVAVDEGIVTLSGNFQHLLAEQIATGIVQRIRGVVSVVDLIEVISPRRADADVQKEVLDALAADVATHGLQVQATIADGVCTFKGDVGSRGQEMLVEQVVAGIVGVQEIDNQLTNAHDPKVPDDVLRKEIGDLLKFSVLLDNATISVRVKDGFQGIATLTGVVADLVAKLAAERAARYTIGVRRVDNQIKVQWPDETPDDANIATMVRESLRRDPYVDVENINVDVEDAHVGLYGIVDSEFEREHAGWMAGRQVGVVHVDNSLTVRKAWVHKTDEAIEKDLKERLAMTFLDEDNQVTCKVIDGVALLEGSVDSWFMWQAAVDQAIAAGAREPHIMINVRYGEANKTPYYGPFDYVPR